MTTVNQIIDIARKQNGLFTRKDLLNAVRSGMKNISEGSLVVLLNRMLAENKIIRVSYGKYKLNEDLKYDFLYEPSEFMLSLNRHIKEKFPFIDYCLRCVLMCTQSMNRIRRVSVQTAAQPLLDIFPKVIRHPQNACLAVVFPIDVIEHLADLLLSQSLAVQSAGQAFAFVLLIAQDRQYLRMKVAIPVSGYTECKSPSLTVGVPHSVPVPLITRHGVLTRVFAPFSDHHTLNHYLQQVL